MPKTQKKLTSALSEESAVKILSSISGGVFTRIEALSVIENAISAADDSGNVRSTAGQLLSELLGSGKITVFDKKNGKYSVAGVPPSPVPNPIKEKRPASKSAAYSAGDSSESNSSESKKDAPARSEVAETSKRVLGGRRANSVGALMRPAVNHASGAQVSFAPGKREAAAAAQPAGKRPDDLSSEPSSGIPPRGVLSAVFDRMETARDEYMLRTESLSENYTHALKRSVRELLGAVGARRMAELCALLVRTVYKAPESAVGIFNCSGDEASVKLRFEDGFSFRDDVVLFCKCASDIDRELSAAELKGAFTAMRDADKGILVTNAVFRGGAEDLRSETKDKNAAVLDGNALVSLMIERGVGILSENGIPTVERAFFE